MSRPLMRALWIERGELSLRQLPRPVRAPGEALLRVRLAGICGTDLALRRGYAGFSGVPGHELVAEVLEADDPSLVGARVVADINLPCGACEACRAGRGHHCPHRTVLGIVRRDGVFAEEVALPTRNLRVVPAALPDEVAVFAEPLAAALAIQEQVQVRSTDRVLVVGAGRLGQLAARVLRLTGCELSVVARHPTHRARLEAEQILVVEENAVEAARFDIVVEASGRPGGYALARHAVRPRGTLVLKSTYPEPVTLEMAPLVVDEVTLVGSRCGPIDLALDLLEGGGVDPRPLTEARFRLDDWAAAFEQAGRPGSLKVLLDPRAP